MDAGHQAVRQLIESSFVHLAQCCTHHGQIDLERMHARQVELFDLAVVAAQAAAAGQLQQQAGALANVATPGAELVRALAPRFAAEALSEALACFAQREAAFGVTAEAVDDLAHRCAAPLQTHRRSDALPELCRLLYAAGPGGAEELNGPQRAFQLQLRRFAEAEIAPLAQPIHRAHLLLPDAIIEGLAALGCFGLSIPVRYGGSQEGDGTDRMAMVLASSELARASFGSAGSLLIRPTLAAEVLLRGATEEQKQRWLPAIARGARQVAVAVTEPDCGTDFAQLRTTARRAPGGWCLSGRKLWCTMAGRAELLLVLARTDPDAADARQGLSHFMVEKPPAYGRQFEQRQADGRLTGVAVDTLGYRGLHTFELVFENFFVPDEQLVGGEAGLGQGYWRQIHSFAGGRVQTAARALGLMAAATEAAMAYAPQRNLFGRRLVDFPLTQQKLVRMAMLLQAGRQLTYASAQECNPVEALIAGAMAKLFTARAAEWVTREAQQVHGGLGYAEESPVARHFVDARLLGIFEGADEVVATMVIGWLLLSKANGAFG